MKLLHREDVEEAGYDMPTTGICANISEFDMEELKFAGEWALADDEVVVADGHQQHHLYVVVSGQVDVYKRTDQASQAQHIATIAQGDAFGEMAFLSGGVASADVQATGQVVLWRIDHERLLEFVGEHRAGGQLCMNVASILSTRLVGGNRKLVDLGKKLQDSLRQLQAASQSGPQNKKALRQMQNRVSGVTTAFAGKEVSKPKLGGLGIAAIVVASVSLLALILMFLSWPSADAEADLAALQDGKDDLARDHGKLVIAHNQLQADKDKQFLKSKRELENLQTDNQRWRLHSGELVAKQHDLIAKLAIIDAEQAKREKEKLVELEKNRPPERPVAPTPPTPTPTPEKSGEHRDGVINWASQWSTVAFPRQVQARQDFALRAGDGAAQIPVTTGKALFALGISRGQLVVGLKSSPPHTFTQVVPVVYTNFVEVATPVYTDHIRRLAEKAANTPTNGTPFPNKPPSTTTPSKPPAPTNDHGSSCVCKDCRKKKKGGSLFPDLPGQ